MSAALSLRFARDVSGEGFEPFLLKLHALLAGSAPRHRARTALELSGSARGLALELWLEDERLASPAAEALRAAFPGGRVVPIGPRTGDLEEFHAFARLTLGRAAAPLRTDLPVPGIAALASSLGGLSCRQRVLAQLVLVPAPAAQGRLLAQADRRVARHPDPWPLAPDSSVRARARREKAATPLYRTSLIVAGSSGAVVRDVAASFAQFAAPYAHVRRHPVLWQARARAQLARRALPLWPRPALTSCAELAGIFGPDAEGLRPVPGALLPVRLLGRPRDAPSEGRVVCLAEEAGKERPVALSRADTRLHLALLGPTGTGKTTAQTNQVLQAIEAGDGAIFLDPKGDAIEETLLRLPERRQGHLVVIDPVTDRNHPVGLNLLTRGPGQDAAAVARSLVAVLRDLNRRNWGARLEDTAYNGLLTAASVAGTTLAELPALYSSPSFRRRFLAAVDDSFVRDFWSWFEGLSEAERGAVTAPVLNKLRPLLRPELAPIISQSESTIDFDRVLAERQILLVRLPRGGELFGALLVARLWQAAERRLAVAESRRADVLLAIDEVHAFLRTGGDVAEMLAMARGLRISLCLATQHLDQCPPELRAALLHNARSRLCFQTTYPDATTLARDLSPDLEAVDLVNLARFQVAARVAVGGKVSAPFVGRTLPLPAARRQTSELLRQSSRQRYGRPRKQVEAELRSRLGGDARDAELTIEGIGRRPR